MFTVIEHESHTSSGVKSAGTLSTGYLNALALLPRSGCRGADLTQMTDKTAPRVTPMHHPDVCGAFRL